MPPNSFEVRGKWPLKHVPALPEPWMIAGRVYVVVLRRSAGDALPEAEIRDEATDAVLATYSWQAARSMFELQAAP